MGIAHQIAGLAADVDAHRLHGRLGSTGGSAHDPAADGQLFAHIHHHLASRDTGVTKLGGRLDVAAQNAHLAGIEADQVVRRLHVAGDVHLIGIQVAFV